MAGYVSFALSGDVEYSHVAAWIAMLQITTARGGRAVCAFSQLCVSPWLIVKWSEIKRENLNTEFWGDILHPE